MPERPHGGALLADRLAEHVRHVFGVPGLENVAGIKMGRDHARYLELLAAFGEQMLA